MLSAYKSNLVGQRFRSDLFEKMRNRARLQSIAPLFTQLLGCLGIRLQAWIARVASFSSRPTLDLSSAISDRITDIRSLEDARSFLFSLLEEYLGVYIANF